MAVYKCTAFKSGDGWKDRTRVGDVRFAYGYELPSPYAEGQFQMVGNTVWSVPVDMFHFEPLKRRQLFKLFPAFRRDIKVIGVRKWLRMMFSKGPDQ